MNFQNFSRLKDKHAFLGASKWHWINYDKDTLLERYNSTLAKERGTRLHALAAELISLKQKLPKSKKTLNRYVNDAIGYQMEPEQILYYSDFCFGTADAISFRQNFLRIHDLKTGKIPAHMEQLLIYAALFCLQYNIKPGEIKIELRIYQNDEIVVHNPEANEILPIMDKIVTFSKILEQSKLEGGI